MNYTYFRMPFLLLCISGLMFTSACKDKGKSISEWQDLAQATMDKIHELTDHIPCDQIDATKVKTIHLGCGNTFFPYTNATEERLNSLLDEYLYYSRRVTEAQIEQGIVFEPCPAGSPGADYIRLDCQDNAVMVVTPKNLPLDEAQEFINAAYERIMSYEAELTCDHLTRLTYIPLLNKEGTAFDVNYILYDLADEKEGIGPDIDLYNTLRSRQIEAQNEGEPEYIRPEGSVEGIECENGKPVIRYTEES